MTLNFELVRWICPFSVAMLWAFCRRVYKLTGIPVTFTKMRTDVHAYLHRLDFFDQPERIARTTAQLDSSLVFSRSIASSNMLELLPITKREDIYTINTRARSILKQWVFVNSDAGDEIVTLLSEACGNVVLHSGTSGVVTIQKYDHRQQQGYTEVQLAIADVGEGIQPSLEKVHGAIADSCAGYIQQALKGFSDRGKDKAGNGLQQIKDIAVKSGGCLYIRSESGSFYADVDDETPTDGLTFIKGTQIGITFRSTI